VTAARRRPTARAAAAGTGRLGSYPSYAPPPEAAGARPGDRKEAEVRRLLAAPHPSIPPDLAERAMARGRRLIRRRRAGHAVGWLLLIAALVTALIHLRTTGSAEVTPPFGG
jgi:hypothetical protein